MKPWVVVPVKRFAAAKSRLSPVLDSAERRRLAGELFEHVLGVLSVAPAVAGFTVITDSRAVAALAEARGGSPLFDPPDAETLSDRVDFALDDAARRSATAIVLMSDLPELHAGDLQMLVDELTEVDVVVARDTRGQHTNALGLRLGTRFPTSFGSANSFHRHCDAAARAGLSVRVAASATLAFDVDTPEDYARLCQSRLMRAGAAV